MVEKTADSELGVSPVYSEVRLRVLACVASWRSGSQLRTTIYKLNRMDHFALAIQPEPRG